MLDERLQQEGVSCPYDLADKSGLDEACEVVLELKARQRQQNVMAKKTGARNRHANPLIDRHMDVAAIRKLFFDANVQSVVAENFGNDLFVWRTNFFVKSEDAGGANSWHHDRHFENGSAPINLYDTNNHFSLLVALTDIDMNSGRIEYMKGSHLPIDGFDRDLSRHIRGTPEVLEDRITPLLFKRGQFVVFYSSLMHRSLAFSGGEGRISMAARIARVDTEIPDFGEPNPAGGAQTQAEPIAHFRESGIMPFN